MRPLIARVRCRRGAVEGFARPMNCLSPEGLRWWQYDVRKEDEGLNPSGKNRVLDDAAVGNAV